MEAQHTYLSIGEVARAFNVTVATVRNWERGGRIRAIRTPGGQRRFLASEVAAKLAHEPLAPVERVS